jgi:hypothetical protein
MVKSSLCNLLLDGFDHHFSHLIEKHESYINYVTF